MLMILYLENIEYIHKEDIIDWLLAQSGSLLNS